jgi:hypothetical protein
MCQGNTFIRTDCIAPPPALAYTNVRKLSSMAQMPHQTRQQNIANPVLGPSMRHFSLPQTAFHTVLAAVYHAGDMVDCTPPIDTNNIRRPEAVASSTTYSSLHGLLPP